MSALQAVAIRWALSSLDGHHCPQCKREIHRGDRIGKPTKTPCYYCEACAAKLALLDRYTAKAITKSELDGLQEVRRGILAGEITVCRQCGRETRKNRYGWTHWCAEFDEAHQVQPILAQEAA